MLAHRLGERVLLAGMLLPMTDLMTIIRDPRENKNNYEKFCVQMTSWNAFSQSRNDHTFEPQSVPIPQHLISLS